MDALNFEAAAVSAWLANDGAVTSYRGADGTWHHRPASRLAENLRLARRWDRAVAVAGWLDILDNRSDVIRRLSLGNVIAGLNLTDDEHAQALAEARAKAGQR